MTGWDRQNFRWSPVLAWIVFWAGFSATASAQEYGFDVWTTTNGMPQNTVTGVVQTPDGYLWLSTFDGLARFDGVRFTIFDKDNTSGIVNNRFAWLFAEIPGELTFEVLWGEDPIEKLVSRDELLRVVATGRLGGRTRYRVWAA